MDDRSTGGYRVIVPTQLNQPILRLIPLNSRARAARPIFDLSRRPVVSGTCPRYKGGRSHFVSHDSMKGEKKSLDNEPRFSSYTSKQSTTTSSTVFIDRKRTSILNAKSSVLRNRETIQIHFHTKNEIKAG